jgi:hypothetical protein
VLLSWRAMESTCIGLSQLYSALLRSDVSLRC